MFQGVMVAMKFRNYNCSRERRANKAIRALRMSGHRFGMFLLDLGYGAGHLDKNFLESRSYVLGTNISINLL